MDLLLSNIKKDTAREESDKDFLLANIIVSEEYSDVENSQLEWYSVFIATIGYVIIVTNLIVLILCGVIIKSGQPPKSSYFHLGNASLSHMYIGASAICVRLPQTYISHHLCVLLLGMTTSSIMISVYSTVLVTVDRFSYILYNQYYRKLGTSKNIRISIFVVWITGIVLGFMPITGWVGDSMNGHKCWYIKLVPLPLLVINAVICLLPVLIVCILYYIILYHALKKVNQLKHASSTNLKNSTEGDNTALRVFRGRIKSTSIISGGRNVSVIGKRLYSDIHSIRSQNQFDLLIETGQQHRNSCSTKTTMNTNNIPANRQPSKWKAIKVVIFMTGSFACTSAPYAIGSFIYVSCMNDTNQVQCRSVEVNLLTSLAILGLSNSLLSPVVCVWWHEGFKRSLKKIILKKIKIFKINASNLT